ncbi:hypothetical protein DEU56DRAFT_816968 [Suillus clintonianus]|uniref:uncharacterized protein n=1 Tax=Suillus clintonianus TaxID=1904413 RepID=UPI001B87A348|nr:uncharacterized protein DEU56DRAFT_816968 [Suillus clintonianus]KAG2129605.1 hypothetical protein DEU56DRAFT_816968 [Suillus clintonianus]
MSPTPGARTPRRVQWATTEDLHEPDSHALDEMAQDPNAFETLKDALERHRSYSLNSPSKADTHTYPPSTPTSSAPTSPTSSTQFLPCRTHALPGEVFIDPLESAGLPLSSRQQSGDSEITADGHVEHLAVREAAGVVRAHTKRWRIPGRRHRSRPRSRAPDPEKENRGTDTDDPDEVEESPQPRQPPKKSWWHFHTPPSVAPTPHHPPRYAQTHAPYDPESHPPLHPSQPKLGSGVLGALLALYGNEHDDHAQSGDESDLSNPDLPWLPHPKSKSQQKHKHKKSYSLSHAHSASLGHTIHSASSSTASLLSSLKPKEKPPSSMAALITGAGTLTGAAAPMQLGLAPDLKRGYGLVRYRYEDGEGAPSEVDLGEGTVTGPVEGEGSKRTPPRLSLRLPRRSKSTDFDFTKGVGGTVEEDHEGEVASKAPVRPPRLETEIDPEVQEEEEYFSPQDTLVPPPTTATTASTPTPTSTTESTPPTKLPTAELKKSKRWKGVLRDLPHPLHGGHFKGMGFSLSMPGTPLRHPVSASGESTPGTGTGTRASSVAGSPDEKEKELDGKERADSDYFGAKWLEEQKERERRGRKERERREKEKRRKRKRAEVYITHHVAAILQRQEFILKLARAMMMFGGPSHRLVAQIQSTARVLELELSCMYLPDVMWISFEDNATGTSNVKFIRQGSNLDLGKLGEAHGLYWDVIHDVISVSSASSALDTLMRKKPIYSFPQLIFLGGMCSSSICSVSFNGSFIDCLVSFPLGALLVTIQLLSVRNELYGNVFEITVATLLSFLSAALASTKRVCYEAVASSSVVLILPGFIVLNGSLEISSRSLIAGSVRLCYALMYSLFLGFGLAIGAELYQTMLGKALVGGTDFMCTASHDPEGGWWQRTPSLWWAFLSVPLYSLFLSLRFGAVVGRRELLLLVAISCIGWVTNHFVSTKFPNQSDISAAVGAFAVGFVSNLYGRFFEGNAFVVMITGILFQLPSGLGNGGLFNFVVDQTSGSSSSYLSGFKTALQLISTSIGLTVGLGISLVLVHPIQSRRRAAGVFSL